MDRAGSAHFFELETSGARDTDAGQCRHFGLVILRCRIAPNGLDRAEWHRRIVGRPPIHHDRADCAKLTGYALFLVPRGSIGKLGQDDLSPHVSPLIIGICAGADVDKLAPDAVFRRE